MARRPFNRIDESLRAWQLVDMKSFLKEYLKDEEFQDFEFRSEILAYEVGDLMKSVLYKKVYGDYEIDLKTKLSDIIMTALMLGVIADIELDDIINIGIQRYHDRMYDTENYKHRKE